MATDGLLKPLFGSDAGNAWRYFFFSAGLSGGASTQVVVVFFVHWPMVLPVVSQARMTQVSHRYFLPSFVVGTAFLLDAGSHLSSACAIVTPAKVSDNNTANVLMVLMIEFHVIEAIGPACN
jgi:hypothetical protein